MAIIKDEKKGQFARAMMPSCSVIRGAPLMQLTDLAAISRTIVGNVFRRSKLFFPFDRSHLKKVFVR